jgi:hypothetical protein
MEGYEVRFRVYADSQAEADQASRAIKDFISAAAQKGVAVTALRLTEAVERWKDSYLVTNYFR